MPRLRYIAENEKTPHTRELIESALTLSNILARPVERRFVSLRIHPLAQSQQGSGLQDDGKLRKPICRNEQ
jgi:hypothetical protein